MGKIKQMKHKLYKFVVYLLKRRQQRLRKESNKIAKALHYAMAFGDIEKAARLSGKLDKLNAATVQHNTLLLNIDNTIKALSK